MRDIDALFKTSVKVKLDRQLVNLNEEGPSRF
jgi:hypothetical protein